VPDPVSGGVSMRVTTSAAGGLVAERPMYFHRAIQAGGPEINDGHVTPGAIAYSTRWLFAEGSTLPGLLPFLTVLVPVTEPATVTITYVPDGGAPVSRTIVAGAASRTTVQVYGDADQGGVGSVVTGFGIT